MSDRTLFDHLPRVKRMGRSGPLSNWWKGGRSIASNGYVLIRVGIEHHLADVRGYAYEHRLNAEKKIGRPLLPGEQVHHVNGNKQDNRIENLEVCANFAEHRIRHRARLSNLRLPNQGNPIVPCACGCGMTFRCFDSAGRPRKFISGHNPPLAKSQDLILSILKDSAKPLAEIIELSGGNAGATKTCLGKLRRFGKVVRVSRGVWARSEAEYAAH